jgi:hypothetical protein
MYFIKEFYQIWMHKIWTAITNIHDHSGQGARILGIRVFGYYKQDLGLNLHGASKTQEAKN